MSLRELIVLGTSGQVPTRHRNHNGYLFRWDTEGFLFDPGEGIQRQMIYANVSTSMITKIFITHFHGDHCLGLAGLSQRISLDQVAHPIEIYYPASGQAYYNRLRKASVFHDTAKIIDCPIQEEGIIFQDKKFMVIAKKLNHTIETYGFRIKETDSVTMLPEKLERFQIRGSNIGKIQREGTLEINGQKISLEEVSIPKPGQVLSFIMDTRRCPNAYELAHEADLLVCEATYLAKEETEASQRGHLTAEQAAQIAKKERVKKLVLSHFSQRYPSLEPIYREAAAIFPDVVVAKDSERVSMPKREKY